jgi:endoglucanase
MRQMRRIALLVLGFALFGSLLTSVHAQTTPLAPAGVPGEYLYIPFSVAIKLDGETKDWANVPTQRFDNGPMRSQEPDKRGRGQVSVAADDKNVFVLMTITDDKIITGQHGADFWNEDSLEFYFNFSGDLARAAYADGVFQININPGNIGNTDPAKVVFTGVNSDKVKVQAIAFKTSDGWGLEAAVPLPAQIKPAHGLEIGFQAQANGANVQDRDLKVIWSKRDTADNSWQDPSVFGSAIFFKIGEKGDPPMPRPRAIAANPTPTPTSSADVAKISVNQTGYFPNGTKQAAIASTKSGPQAWSLHDATNGKKVAEGKTSEAISDRVSQQQVYVIDFSSFNTPGSYKLVVDSVESASFKIANDIYSQLKIDALAYFYHNRSGIELKPEIVGKTWARPAGHLSDSSVTCFKGKDADGKQWDGCDYMLDASKGWYDAGDYGKYVVNGGITVWTLLNLHERNPKAYSNTGTVPPLLDEVRWEMEFLLNMQIPEGKPLAGMAFHKMHDLVWSGVPVMPPTNYNNNSDFSKQGTGRYAYEPTTAATLNLAAVAAQCARIWANTDKEFSARCLKAAEAGWQAAQANPNMLAGRVPGAGGGDYGDNNVQDEFYWAAAELFITTGKDLYRDALTKSSYFKSFPGLTPGKASPMNWGDTAALGTISLVVVPNKLTKEEIASLRDQIVQTADKYLKVIQQEGFRVPIQAEGYVWGSNSVVLNNALILALAYDFTQNREYLAGVTQSMDYILGMNALNKSFVSGYGADPMQHPHHRFWGNKPGAGFPPPPPGALAGGPNATADDPGATKANLKAKPIAMRYVDDIESYSTNEVAINWNAPLTWVAAYLDEQFNK